MIKKLSILTLFLFCINSYAEDNNEQFVHDTAHFGASYAINMFSYGLFRKAFKMDQTNALIFSAFTTLAIGFTYKYMEGMESGQMPANLGRAMLLNTAGVGGAVFTVKAFDF